MIVAISGATASGKTSLAQSIAARTGGMVASFGDYVRALTLAQGRTIDRSTLQEIGQAAVDAGPDAFLIDFLRWIGWQEHELLILDGLRHVSVRDTLRTHAARAGIDVRFVHVDADPAERIRRLRARGDDDAAIASQDAHASEQDVMRGLRDDADLRICRTDDISAMAGRVEDALGIKPLGMGIF